MNQNCLVDSPWTNPFLPENSRDGRTEPFSCVRASKLGSLLYVPYVQLNKCSLCPAESTGAHAAPELSANDSYNEKIHILPSLTKPLCFKMIHYPRAEWQESPTSPVPEVLLCMHKSGKRKTSRQPRLGKTLSSAPPATLKTTG